MARLSDEQVRERLATLAGWVLDGQRIRKTWTFDGFGEAMAFANRVAEVADAADHHPDILIEYRRVTLALTTHDSGGLTGRDFRLAARIEELGAGGGSR